jgi:surface antigen
MTRDTEDASVIQRRAKRPISTLTVSLLTLACSVGFLTQTAFADARTTRDLNAAAAAAGGHAVHRFETAAKTADTAAQLAQAPAAQAPLPVRRAIQNSAAPVTAQPAVVRGTEQRQIQRVAMLKGERRSWSCVPFARELTGFQISGDAYRWWDGAAGRYSRGHMPATGSVIVLKSTRGMRSGHVAVVRRVVSAREIVVDHANWAPRGRVNEPTRVIDVSRNNDWSQTRFWHQPSGQMGTTVYPTYGFIYPQNTQVAERD